MPQFFAAPTDPVLTLRFHEKTNPLKLEKFTSKMSSPSVLHTCSLNLLTKKTARKKKTISFQEKNNALFHAAASAGSIPVVSNGGRNMCAAVKNLKEKLVSNCTVC